jgi:hypothetical protein
VHLRLARFDASVGRPTDGLPPFLLNTTGAAWSGVNPEYDLFEKFPDGSVLWKGCVAGLENAIAKLKHEASLSPNEHFARHSPTNTIVARLNVSESDTPGSSE